MARSNIDIKFELAQNRQELHKFFGGYPEYSIPDVFADVPTDFGAAFTPIRMRIKDEPELGQLVRSALLQLSKDVEYAWTVLEGIIQLCLIRDFQGIDLLHKDFIAEIMRNLLSIKDSLIACKRWKGTKVELGAWSMVISANSILHDDYNITVLPEEL